MISERSARRGGSGEASVLDLWELADRQHGPLQDFLRWARESERDQTTSNLIEHRLDLQRARRILPLFAQSWWGIVVYSCFDSEVCTRAVARLFQRPVSGPAALSLVEDLALPTGGVQAHRTRRGHTGAKRALVAACAQAPEFEQILLEMNRFHDRYEALRRLGAAEWGRTTCFDLLVRAGVLEIGGNAYGPDRVYLEGSTGPSRGFQLVWCISVEHRNAERCEKLLRQTDEAREDLTVILDQSDASKEQSLRLVEGDGQYRFAVDQEREDDQTFKPESTDGLGCAGCRARNGRFGGCGSGWWRWQGATVAVRACGQEETAVGRRSQACWRQAVERSARPSGVRSGAGSPAAGRGRR